MALLSPPLGVALRQLLERRTNLLILMQQPREVVEKRRHSIFSRAPLCPNTCRHCRSKPCDIATDHDAHICYNCEQRLLFPERIPKWETLNLPICDLWCQECATQRCCTRGSHKYHLCMQCERRGVVFLAPDGGEDPWAANDD